MYEEQDGAKLSIISTMSILRVIKLQSEISDTIQPYPPGEAIRSLFPNEPELLAFHVMFGTLLIRTIPCS